MQDSKDPAADIDQKLKEERKNSEELEQGVEQAEHEIKRERATPKPDHANDGGVF